MASHFPAFRHNVALQMAGYRERLAAKINSEMGSRSWSVEDLAYKSGVSAKTIKRIQKGKHDPRPSTVRRLAEGLKLDPTVLSPEAETDQPERLEEKLDEMLARLRFQQAEQLSKAAAARLRRELQQSLEEPGARSQEGSGKP